jgi:hypothetical protein
VRPAIISARKRGRRPAGYDVVGKSTAWPDNRSCRSPPNLRFQLKGGGVYVDRQFDPRVDIGVAAMHIPFERTGHYPFAAGAVEVRFSGGDIFSLKPWGVLR